MFRRVLSVRLRMLFVALVTPVTLLLSWLPAAAQLPANYGQLKYRHVGPVGNRVSAVAGVAGDPNTYYFGAASGGIFKTTDGGVHWTPVFDDQPVSSIGSLAVAPSDPNIVWAGTGEAWIRSNISIGNGIYKSTDTGKTWKLMGLEKTGRIGRVVVHPRNPDIVFAATLGHSYGPQPDRGLYRTTDGGKTWERVLFVDENTGCADVVMDPNNPLILFAGMWQLNIRTWGRTSGGPGSGLYVSRDGGSTWTHLTGHGLPETEMGKIGLAIAPTNSSRIYALIETADEGLWRSDDGGVNWKQVSHDHNLSQRWAYYTRMAVEPDNQNEFLSLGVQLSVSIDGGETIKSAAGGRHGDNHDIWIDPTNANRLIIGNDAGAIISTNRGQSWFRPQLPIAQMYHVFTDNQVPYYLYGNRQDGPSARVPSNSRLTGEAIPIGLFGSVGGCESGFAIPDPVDNKIVWSDCYLGRMDRFDLRTGHTQTVTVWPDIPEGWPGADVKYRWQWTAPIAISPHDHNKVYTGSQYLHVTTDGGRSWKVISPDLTTNDKTRQGPSGGITLDNLGPEIACVIFAIAESPLEKGLIWVGTNDGQVQVTRDDGAHWANVTANIPNLPAFGTIGNIEPSRFDGATAYLTVDAHQENNRDPFIYKTADYGKTWRSISGDIPRTVVSYAHCIREDPVRKGLLYAGTENAVYVSFNDGANWLPLQSNLPHAPAYWLTIQEDFSDLVVATYGRGFWILDDMTPVRQLTPKVLESAAHLFEPRPVYRFRNLAPPMAQPEDPAAGQNPPYGAPLTYYLKAEPKEKVKITILDAEGAVVRTLDGSKETGLNRIWWDLRYEVRGKPKIRTAPAGHDHVALGPEGWRPLTTIYPDPTGALVTPGTYTVVLNAGGSEYRQKLILKKDPNTPGTEADVQAQVKLLREMSGEVSAVAEMIDQLELVRTELIQLKSLVAGDKASGPVTKAADQLDEKVIAVEAKLFRRQMTNARQDSNRYPDRLYSKLLGLFGQVESPSDQAPTTQAVEVHAMFKKQLADCRAEFERVLGSDIPAFNTLLKEHNIQNIIVQRPKVN